LARSKREHLFVTRVADRIVGACILSLSPESLTRRLALHTPLLWFAALALIRHGLARSMLRGGGHAAVSTHDKPVHDLPEVLLIFTAADARGTGIGSALLSACERTLAARGLTEYLVRTIDDEANAAIRFYTRNGFQNCGHALVHGRWFQVLKKTLAVESANSQSDAR
jgi:GNAT superfamily N-acetyltransferase